MTFEGRCPPTPLRRDSPERGMPWPSLSPPGFTPAPCPKEATQTAQPPAYQLCPCSAADPDHQEAGQGRDSGHCQALGPEEDRESGLPAVTPQAWDSREWVRGARAAQRDVPWAPPGGCGEEPAAGAGPRVGLQAPAQRGVGGASAPPLSRGLNPAGVAGTDLSLRLAPGPGGGGRAACFSGLRGP